MIGQGRAEGHLSGDRAVHSARLAVAVGSREAHLLGERAQPERGNLGGFLSTSVSNRAAPSRRETATQRSGARLLSVMAEVASS